MTPFLVLHGRKSVNCLCQIFCGLKCLTNLELIEWKAVAYGEVRLPLNESMAMMTFMVSSNFEGKGTKSFGIMRFLLFFPVFACTPVTGT